MIGADSLGFLDINRLNELIGGSHDYCDACFNGKYPVEPVDFIDSTDNKDNNER